MIKIFSLSFGKPILFSHGVSSAMLTHPMGYRLADDRELASPPTYPESYRSVRYTQDPPRVTQRRWGSLFHA